jgi:3-oxoacyl-[acyl-carrier protein] reductase
MNEIMGKTALITGAAGGIGAATARLFAREGALLLILSDVNKQALEDLAEEIQSGSSCKCYPFTTDLSDETNIRELFEYAREECGGLDILVNCAGICHVLPLEQITTASWDRTMEINLRGLFLCCQKAMGLMTGKNSGSIVNLTSISGQIGGIATGVDYVVSKGGILAMTKALAKIGGPDGITVNNVSPGFIDTPMTKSFTHFDPAVVPLRRIGQPEEVADVILFLSSSRSRYITGDTVNVNGGVFMG